MKLSKGFIFSVIASLSWAVLIVVTRYALKGGEDAYNLLFWTTVGSLPIWSYVFYKNKAELTGINRKTTGLVIAMGLISSLGVGAVETFALKYSTAVNFSFLIRTTLLFTIVLAYFFLDEKITKKKIILAVLLLSGAYLVTTKGQIISLGLGDIFTLIEAFMIAFGNNVLGKMVAGKFSAKLSASMNYLVGLLPIVTLSMMRGTVGLPMFPMLIAILVLFQLSLMFFRFSAYQHASASYVTMVYSFTPVFVSVMAIFILGESLTGVQMVGGLLIVLAGVLVEKLKIH